MKSSDFVAFVPSLTTSLECPCPSHPAKRPTVFQVAETWDINYTLVQGHGSSVVLSVMWQWVTSRADAVVIVITEAQGA